MSLWEQRDADRLAKVSALIASAFCSALEGSALLELLLAISRSARPTNREEASFVLLPVRICQAAGGDPERAVPISAAWWLLHMAARLLDDVEDDQLGEKQWPSMGAAGAINAGTALIFASQLVLASDGWTGGQPQLSQILSSLFSATALRVCAGQHLDISNQICSLEDYWQVAAAKSGEVFSLACLAGATLAGVSPEQAHRYADFGHNLGVLIQIGDDLKGFWSSHGHSGLARVRQTLPVVYALSVAAPGSRQRLLDLLSCPAVHSDWLTELQQTVAELGALQYAIVRAEVFRRRAERTLPLSGASSSECARLLSLLAQAMPVRSTARP